MEHPIQVLMKTAMESIKGMVDVNTVVGDAVEAPDGTVIIPVSRVSLGFVAGGGQYASGPEAGPGRRGAAQPGEGGAGEWPFGGGSGAGVSVSPLGFLVVTQQSVRFLPVDQRATLERILDAAPDLLERLQAAWRKDGRQRQDGQAQPGAASAAGEAVPHRSGFEELDEYDDL